MLLNTKIILEQVLVKENKDIPNTNPLKIKNDLLEAESIEKEKELQEKVAVIFKDKKYYKNFQESALGEPVKQAKTPEEIADEKAEKAKDKQTAIELKKAALSAAGGAFGYALPNAIISVAGKGIEYGVKGVRSLMGV
jgi:hypothetical protein